jgi:hypothetical protein
MVMPALHQGKTLAASDAATEEGRRPTIVAAPDAASPELSPRARRRSFTAADKLRLLAEVDGGGGRALRLLGNPMRCDLTDPTPTSVRLWQGSFGDLRPEVAPVCLHAEDWNPTSTRWSRERETLRALVPRGAEGGRGHAIPYGQSCHRSGIQSGLFHAFRSSRNACRFAGRNRRVG